MVIINYAMYSVHCSTMQPGENLVKHRILSPHYNESSPAPAVYDQSPLKL